MNIKDRPGWMGYFSDEQQKEIEFSCVYDKNYRHGTDGHNSKIIIARFSLMLGRVTEITTKLAHSQFEQIPPNKRYTNDLILQLCKVLGIEKAGK